LAASTELVDRERVWLTRANRVYQGWLDKEVAKVIAMARDDPGTGDRSRPPAEARFS